MSHNMFIGSGKRSGTRGGADQFSWEKVKGDKYKDYYLGHSLHTTAKPTFNNRKPNPLWWTKGQPASAAALTATSATLTDDASIRRAEIAAIKREEEQLHLEALGLAPRRRKTQETQLDSTELQELTRRGNTERDAHDAERVAGLGFAPAPQHHLPDLDLRALGPPTTASPTSQVSDRGRPHESGLTHGPSSINNETRGDHHHQEKGQGEKTTKEERREERQRRKEQKRSHKKQKRDKKNQEEPGSRSRHNDESNKIEKRKGYKEDEQQGQRGGDDRRRRRDTNEERDRKQRIHQREERREDRHHRAASPSSRSPSPKRRRRRHDSPSPPPGQTRR